MIIGMAIGYMLGVLVTFGLMVIFGICSAANAYEGDLSRIYDPETLDLNAEGNDSTGNEETGDEKNGR